MPFFEGSFGAHLLSQNQINGNRAFSTAFQFTEAISFVVNCETQEEVNHYWEKLSAGGAESQCGWLKDRFGLSWQIVPSALARLLSDPDPAKAGRVMQAMMTMQKIEIRALEEAANKG